MASPQIREERHDDDMIRIEILCGGRTRQLKLPDAGSVPLHYVSGNDLPGRIRNTPS